MHKAGQGLECNSRDGRGGADGEVCVLIGKPNKGER